jgi:hypothetical protein
MKHILIWSDILLTCWVPDKKIIWFIKYLVMVVLQFLLKTLKTT